jgi:hypothetical protein
MRQRETAESRQQKAVNEGRGLYCKGVIPAEAGIQVWLSNMDSRFRGNDGGSRLRGDDGM